jgi:hypothetical protein
MQYQHVEKHAGIVRCEKMLEETRVHNDNVFGLEQVI